MPEWVQKELRENYAKVSRRGRREARTVPRAARVRYLSREQLLKIELTSGVSITIPIALIPYLKGAGPDEIGTVEVLGRGGGLHWESLDLSVPAPVSAIFPGRPRQVAMDLRDLGDAVSPAQPCASPGVTKKRITAKVIADSSSS